MDNRFFKKYGKLILLLFVLSYPLVYLGSEAAFKTNSNRVKDWLPKGFEETQELEWFIEQFGGDDLMVVSWDGYTVGNPKAQALAEKLRGSVRKKDGRSIKLFRDVRTAHEARERLKDILREAAPNRGEEWYAEKSIRQLEGWIVGPRQNDGSRLGSMIVLFTPDGFDERHYAVDLIRKYAKEDAGITAEELHIGGPTMDSVAIDEASESRMDELTKLSVAIAMLIAFVCFRSFLVTLFVLLIGYYNQFLCLALLYATGETMDSIQLMIPPLVLVLSISGAVHLVNYYRDSVIEDGIEGAPTGALRHGWVPCTLASATTSLGLISLLVSFLIPIQKFGTYAALGVMCGTGVLFLVLPSMLTVFPPRRWCEHLSDKPKRRSLHIPWPAVIRVVWPGRYVIAIVGCVVLGVCFVGVINIGATARIHNMFSHDAKILRDYWWLEENVGPLVPVEIVIRLPRAPEEIGEQPENSTESDTAQRFPYPMLDRIAIVRHFQEVIHDVEGVESVMSLGKFAPIVTEKAGTIKKASFNRVMTDRRPDFIEAALLQTEGDFDLWRISARVYAGERHNFSELMSRIQNAVEPELEQIEQKYNLSEASAVYTGGVPIVMKAQAQLLVDLKNSFTTAFICIAIAMVVLIFGLEFWEAANDFLFAPTLIRSVLGGLLCMIPNVLPAVVVFGIMGLTGIQVEVGSMMTATAAMGIAVDDTLHYLTWYRRGISEGKSRRESVLFAYERCGTAMIQTTLICGLGLVVFALSPFGPIMRFALMMFSMLAAAIVGDLVVLPALLLTPLGRVFDRREKPAKAASPVPQGSLE